MANTKLVENDHGTIIRCNIKDEKGTRIDTTGATSVKIRWVQASAVEERTMTANDAATGIWDYVIVSGDFLETTKLEFEVRYVDADGNRYTTAALLGNFGVRAELAA